MVRLGLLLIALYSLLTGTARAEKLAFLEVDSETNKQIEASIDAVLNDYRSALDLATMSEKWLGDEGVFTKEKFERVIAWIVNDGPGRQLIGDVMKRARVKKVSDLMPLITVKDVTNQDWMNEASNEHVTLTGVAQTVYSYTLPSGMIPDIERISPIADVVLSSETTFTDESREAIYALLFSQHQEKLAKEDGLIRDVFFVRSSPDFSLVLAMEIPRILMEQNTSLRSAVLSLAHEFVHFAYVTFVDRLKLIDFDDDDDAAYAYVGAQGEEVDAYIFQMGLNARIYGSTTTIDSKVRKHFSQDGAFIGDRRLFAKYVLDSLGYKKRFNNEYTEELISAYNREYKAFKKLSGLLSLRDIQKKEYEDAAVYYEKAKDLEKAAAAERNANACMASQVRIRKLIKEYEGRIKKYEDKLGIVREKKAS